MDIGPVEIGTDRKKTPQRTQDKPGVKAANLVERSSSSSSSSSSPSNTSHDFVLGDASIIDEGLL